MGLKPHLNLGGYDLTVLDRAVPLSPSEVSKLLRTDTLLLLNQKICHFIKKKSKHLRRLGQLQLHDLLLSAQELVVLKVHPVRVLGLELHQLLDKLLVFSLNCPKLGLCTCQRQLQGLVLVLKSTVIIKPWSKSESKPVSEQAP